MNRFVLIETYWNVNSGEPVKNIKSEKVLIETYWNVNAFPNSSSSIANWY